MARPLYVMRADVPWFAAFKMGFDQAFNDWAHTQPGIKWDKPRGFWHIPIELIDQALVKAREAGFECPLPIGDWYKDIEYAGVFRKQFTPHSKLHPYQVEHARWHAHQERSIEASEMGLGKTPIVLTSAQWRFPWRGSELDIPANSQRGVIVDTAGHRRDWFDKRRHEKSEFGKWWADRSDVEVIEDGKKAKTSTAPIRVVSYQLLHKLDLDQKIDFFWADEAHMFQNPKTLWYRAAKALLLKHTPWTIFLTGTLIPNDVMTLFPILDLLWPNRFGWHPAEFGRAYSIGMDTGYGTEFAGLNEARAPELAARLAAVSRRKTKLEVADLLPPFIVRMEEVEGSRVASAIEWVKNMRGNGVKHMTVLTHFRKTAQEIAAKLPEIGGIQVECLTGELPPGQRHEHLARLRSHEGPSVLVATLHAVATGVDLTYWPVVAFAEIYPRLVEMIQVLGRFHRMTSKEPADITIFAAHGGDTQAETLLNRVRAAALLMKAGTSEEGLAKANEELQAMGLTAQEVNEMLQASAASFIAEEF